MAENQVPEHLYKAILEGTPADIIARYASLKDAAKREDFGEYDTNIIVIDTETTGVSLKKNELTQIAAARLEHGEITEWFVTFVNPGHPIPDDIVHLTHITDEDVSDAPTPQEALEKLVEFVGDAKLVAHNAYFDKNFVTKHPQGYPLLENQWIDSLELSRIALPRMKSHRLIDLVKAFDAPLSTHRADADVVATCALYRILLAGVDAIPEGLLQEIASWAAPDTWPFGKIFAFFAERRRQKREEAQAHNKPQGAVTLPEMFSLAETRARRVQTLDRKTKADAAGMFTQELLERMQHAGATIKSSDGGNLQTLKFPTSECLEDAFSADGLMGRIYNDYECRSQQTEMASAVRDAFESSENLMVEAGTGTGKSMAYLVPCAMTATQNGIGVGIATKTNALLDQLVYKELPALAKAMGGTFTYAPLKGYTHYPCLLKVQRILRDGPRMKMVANEEKPQAPALASLLSFIEQTAYDDMDSLKIDYRTLPRQSVTTTSNDCLRRRCPFYGDACFVHGSRALAECADIVVTNHSLLFYDTAANNSLLPPIRYWVVDEAHGVEDEARRALSLTVSIDALNRLVRRVCGEDPRTNVILSASRKVVSDTDKARTANADADQSVTGHSDASSSGAFAADPGTLFYALVSKAQAQAQRFAEAEANFADQTTELLYFDTQKKSGYEMFDLWINQETRASSIFSTLQSFATEMVETAEKLVRLLQEMVALLDDVKGAGFAQRELASVALELKELIRAAEVIFVNPTDAYVYSATLNRREHKGVNGVSAAQHTGRGGNAFHAALYNIGAELDDTLYANTRSVVYTSATLTVGDSFEPFEEAVGLNTSPQSKAQSLKLAPCFDFDNNMRVYVVSDMPEPHEDAYMGKLQNFLREAHLAQGGAMLTLFTNKRDMDVCYEAVGDALKEADLRLVCQRWGVSNKTLRDDFIADEALSLFALKSFWEGFDAPGSTLKGVVIPKLPFGRPTDPLSLERKSRDDNAWKHFDLPRAVIDVRQATGRLIRKATDTGAVILCDARLLSKWYGRIFISSMPSQDIRVMPAKEICHELTRGQ